MNFTCPVCLESEFKQLIFVLTCSHNICTPCSLALIDSPIRKCPYCREPIEKFIPNYVFGDFKMDEDGEKIKRFRPKTEASSSRVVQSPNLENLRTRKEVSLNNIINLFELLVNDENPDLRELIPLPRIQAVSLQPARNIDLSELWDLVNDENPDLRALIPLPRIQAVSLQPARNIPPPSPSHSPQNESDLYTEKWLFYPNTTTINPKCRIIERDFSLYLILRELPVIPSEVWNLTTSELERKHFFNHRHPPAHGILIPTRERYLIMVQTFCQEHGYRFTGKALEKIDFDTLGSILKKRCLMESNSCVGRRQQLLNSKMNVDEFPVSDFD